MSATPLVSILMTAYNREDFIGFAIDSVIGSTYQNWELIIVDDRSKDRTVEIARGYAAKDARINVYVNETNLGDYPNRNKAASYAKGKYLKYIDADDAIYYWGLQAEVEMMELFPEAGYGLDSINQDDERIFPYILTPHQAYDSFYSGKLNLFAKAPTSCIIKRDVFVAVKGFKELRMVGDMEMWHRLSASYAVVAMPHGIIWSRGHSGSESGKYMTDLATIYHYNLISRNALTDHRCPLQYNEKKKYIQKYARVQWRLVLKLLLTVNIEAFKKVRSLGPIPLTDLLKLANGL